MGGFFFWVRRVLVVIIVTRAWLSDPSALASAFGMATVHCRQHRRDTLRFTLRP